jgi:hypothetical protein
MGDCIACGAATPKPLRAASSPHRGQCPSASVLSESTVEVSNWGGSAEANSIDFFHLLSSFPVIVRRPILLAIVIRRRRHPPPSSSAVAVIVCRRGLPPLQPSSPLSCLQRLLPPSSLPHCSPSPNLACLHRPPLTVAAAVVSSAAPFS